MRIPAHLSRRAIDTWGVYITISWCCEKMCVSLYLNYLTNLPLEELVSKRVQRKCGNCVEDVERDIVVVAAIINYNIISIIINNNQGAGKKNPFWMFCYLGGRGGEVTARMGTNGAAP